MAPSSALAIEVLSYPKVSTRPALTKLCLALADAAALLFSVGLSIGAKALFESDVSVGSYLQLWPFLFAFLIVYKAIGLYSIVGLTPSEEFRYSSGASAMLFLLLAIVTTSLRGAQKQLTWTLVLALVMSVGMIPLLRHAVRYQFAARSWWGYPAIIFGAGRVGVDILRTIADQPGLGLKASGLIDQRKGGIQMQGTPVFRSFEDLLPSMDGRRPYAIFAMEDLSAQERIKLVDRYREHFSHVLIVPQLDGIVMSRVVSKNLNGMLGLEMPGS